MEMRDILVYLSFKNEGSVSKILRDMDNRVRVRPDEIDKMKQHLKYKYVTIIDSNYP